MKEISVIINARLQSSRMEQKMLRPFCNTDLLEIALEKINHLDYFEHRFLAVAEDELISKAEKYHNIEILKRKVEAVEPGPHHPTVTFEHYKRVPTEYFFVLNACAAFVSLDTIKRAYDAFQHTDFRAYIAGVETRDWVFSSEGMPLTHVDPDALQNTSDGKSFLKVVHSFYIANRDYFINNDGKLWTLTVNDPHIICIPIDEAYDVDTDLDFEISECVYQKKYIANA